METLAEKYVLLDSLPFKIVSSPEKEVALLAIPEICADKIITLYHSSLFAGHQGVIKRYLTINNKCFYSKFNTLFVINPILKVAAFVSCHVMKSLQQDNYRLAKT